MGKLKKWFLLLVFGGVLTTSAMGINSLKVAKAEDAPIISGAFATEYAVKERIEIPEFQLSDEYVVNVQMYENDNLKILESYENADNMIYTFENVGTYVISYIHYVEGNSMQAYNYTFDVVEKPVFDLSAFPDQVNINEKVEFGEIKLRDGKKSKTAEVSATTPSGKIFDVSNGVFDPEELGDYHFVVNASWGGKEYSYSFTVNVVADPALLFDCKTVEFISDYDLPSWSVPGNGILMTTTTTQSTVRYTNVIDLSKLNSDTPLIEFQVLYGKDEKTGYTFADLGQGWSTLPENLRVKVVDIYDESKYVIFRWRAGEWYAFGTESGKEISYVGTAPSTTNVPKWDTYFAGRAEMLCTFRGEEGKHLDARTGNLFNFSMDYETNTSYINTVTANNPTLTKYAVANYSDKDIFGKNAFDKFTTGEVYLELTFGRIDDGDRGGIVVTSIAGNSLSGKTMKGDGNNQEMFQDNIKPNIILDLKKDYETNMPTGYVNVAYPVPSAYALDAVSGKCNVQCGVMEMDTKAEYPIRNGSFTPDKAGTYRITYTTVDGFGNTDLRVLNVTVKDETCPKIVFDFLGEVEAKYKFDFTIPKFTVSGGSGDVEYSYKLYYNDEEVELTKKLTLNKLGVLKFVFEATDYLGTGIANSDNALLIEIVQTDDIFVTYDGYIPKYIKQGSQLLLPDFVAISGSEADAVKTIKVNGVELGADRIYNVNDNVGSVLIVEYIANNGKEWKETFAVTVVSNEGDVQNAFVTNMGAGKLEQGLDAGLTYSVNGDKYYALVNPIASDSFVFRAKFNVRNLESQILSFYDCYSSNKIVTWEINYNGVNLVLTINGKEEYKFSPNATYNDGTLEIYLHFNSETGRIADYNDLLIGYVTTYENGEEYVGLQENMAYISVSLNGANRLQYTLLRIGNQTFGTYSNMIAIGPQVVIDGELMSQYIQKGDIIEIPKAKGVDVVDGLFDVYVSVLAPNGSYIFQDEKADVVRNFTATETGIYRITYYSVDNHQGRGEATYDYTIPEYEGPVIIVNRSDIKVAVGEKFSIPQATATDNMTPEDQIMIYAFIIDENNHYTLAEGEYAISKAGKYTLVYVALDMSGNVSRKTVTIFVN